jgi:hypothetical protein
LARTTWVLPLFLACAFGGHAQDKAAPEYRLKARVLAHLASPKLVEWPGSAFPEDVPYTVGIFGRDPFQSVQDELAEAFKGLRPQGRPVRILRAKSAEELTKCHLVFVAGKESSRADEVLKVVAGRPVLLAGEVPGFAADGGGLNFFMDGGLLRFELNPEALKRAGLSPSAQLLKLAVIVKDGR